MRQLNEKELDQIIAELIIWLQNYVQEKTKLSATQFDVLEDNFVWTFPEGQDQPPVLKVTIKFDETLRNNFNWADLFNDAFLQYARFQKTTAARHADQISKGNAGLVVQPLVLKQLLITAASRKPFVNNENSTPTQPKRFKNTTSTNTKVQPNVTSNPRNKFTQKVLFNTQPNATNNVSENKPLSLGQQFSEQMESCQSFPIHSKNIQETAAEIYEGFLTSVQTLEELSSLVHAARAHIDCKHALYNPARKKAREIITQLFKSNETGVKERFTLDWTSRWRQYDLFKDHRNTYFWQGAFGKTAIVRDVDNLIEKDNTTSCWSFLKF